MKSLNMVKSKIIASIISLFVPILGYAQKLKVSDFEGIQTEVEKGSTTFRDTAFIVAGTALALALIFVIWEIATGKQNAKEHLIGWFIAVGVCILGGLII